MTIELSAQLAQQTHLRGCLIAERRAPQIEARDATRLEANELRKLSVTPTAGPLRDAALSDGLEGLDENANGGFFGWDGQPTEW
jgi:hypothetical protein